MGSETPEFARMGAAMKAGWNDGAEDALLPGRRGDARAALRSAGTIATIRG
jgi:hypothetical protein